MKKVLPVLLAALLGGASPALATDVGVDLNIHLGNRAPAPIIVEEPPLFLVPATLGFHVAVGVPYDMFYLSGRYYLCRENAWYVAPAYGGPWAVVVHDRLPPGLRKHKFKELVAVRDAEYRRYRREDNHYRGKTFKPERARHEHDDRHDDRGDRWKEAKHGGKGKHKHDD